MNDPYILGPYLRKEDVAEIKASTGDSPTISLIKGVIASRPCYTAVNPSHPDRVMGMFGAVPEKDNGISTAIIWAVFSEDMFSHKRAFLEVSKEVINRYSKQYDVLTNWVDARNEDHIKWLRSLGFTFIDKNDKYDYEQRTFYEFIKVTEQGEFGQ